MATNGICSIRVKGVEYPLYFGRQAVEELALRTEANFSSNSFKILLDMVYAGMSAHAAKNGMPYPKESDVYQLVEDFLEEEDSAEQHDAIDECFKQSKYGSDYLKQLDDLKKKMDSLVKKVKSVKKTTGKTSKSTA